MTDVIDLAAVRLTRQKVSAGIWICAGLTMVASAISGVTAFYYLQKDGWGIASGAMTAFAVDVALWVVLTGDKLMEAIGITAGPWARTVRWGTAAMSVTLNVTAAAVADIPSGAKIPLTTLHIFVPLVMVGLAELRGEYARKLAPKEQEALEQEEARQRALDTPIVTPSERISPEVGGYTSQTPLLPDRRTRELEEVGRTYHPAVPASGTQSLAQPAPKPAYVEVPQPVTSSSSPLRPVTPLRPRTPPAVPGAKSQKTDRILNYLNTHHRGDPYGITSEILASKTKQNVHTCKKVLTEWRKTLPSDLKTRAAR